MDNHLREGSHYETINPFQNRRDCCSKDQNVKKKRGLTQKSLAKAAGLHRTYLAKIETDKKLPLLKTICALADVFEIEVAEFLIPKETHKRLSQKKKELIKVVRESTPGEINTYFKIVSALDKKR